MILIAWLIVTSLFLNKLKAIRTILLPSFKRSVKSESVSIFIFKVVTYKLFSQIDVIFDLDFQNTSVTVIYMEINKLTIFTATQKSRIEDTTLYKSIQQLKIDAEVNLQCIESNTEPLAIVYNEAMRNASEDEADALILVHDDVWLEHDPVPKLRQLFDKYDLVGVAGASKATFQEPALWHLMGGGFQGGHLHGCVQHSYIEKHPMGMEVYKKAPSNFGPHPHRVVMIDGVFMAMNRMIMEEVQFDEECPSGFHMYDLIFSNRCFNLGYKIGVGDILITHESPGLREYTQEFLKGQEYFLKWYGN